MSEPNITYIAGLVLRSKANDSDAFAELYSLTYNKVYNYCRHYLKDNDLAQDALQEIYILALKNLNKLNDPTLFIAWLNRITFRVCYDMRNDCIQKNGQAMDLAELENITADPSDNEPETVFSRKEKQELILKALDALPFHDKELIIMRYYNNMKLDDIANSTGISLSSVKRHIASAQKKLQNILKH